MTDFVQFTPARKAQIKYLRTRLMTVKPERDLKYGTKYKRLFLTDFVVYAALRGADFRKGDHTGGREAITAMQQVIRHIVYWGTSTSSFGVQFRDRFLPAGQTIDDLMDLKTILEESLAKWKDA